MNQALQFKPHPLLRNRHIQSLLASTSWRKRRFIRNDVGLLSNQQQYDLELEEGVVLRGYYSAQKENSKGLVLLFHGWEGSSESTYMVVSGQYLYAAGFDVFRLNFRDHGDTHHLNRELFHSCRLDEVLQATLNIQRKFPQQALFLLGFSLGGNFALRVALAAKKYAIRIAKVVAVSPVIDPQKSSRAITDQWVYHRYFIRKWLRSLKKKQAAFPQHYDFTRFLKLRDIEQLTQQMLLEQTSYSCLESYFQGYSLAGSRLSTLTTPTWIITSADDPVIPVDDFRQLKLSASTELSITKHGGHCGFIEDFEWISWAERHLSHYFST